MKSPKRPVDCARLRVALRKILKFGPMGHADFCRCAYCQSRGIAKAALAKR